MLFSLLLLSLILVSGCAKHRVVRLPPVVEGWHKSTARKNAYMVQQTDTLYSIAWAFGIDYRDLATINNLPAPYILRRGQRLYFVAPSKLAKRGKDFQIKSPPLAHGKTLLGWSWPTFGKVGAPFNNKLGGNKGIDIVGVSGQPILACNHGRVVYSGTGISSYGKLIIIKHNDDYLSAYAYNQDLLVDEGQTVKTGQKIATMGRNNDGNPSLHFEIRYFGKPTNPLLYLPKKI